METWLLALKNSRCRLPIHFNSAVQPNSASAFTNLNFEINMTSMTIAPPKCCHCNVADVHEYPFATEGVKCAHTGCSTAFHARCCSLAARGVGILCDPTKPDHMLCTIHFNELSLARRRQRIFFKYVQAAGESYLDAKVTTNDEPHAPLTVQPANVLGMITQTPMEQLCAGGSIGDGGFRQRAVASFGASVALRRNQPWRK